MGTYGLGLVLIDSGTIGTAESRYYFRQGKNPNSISSNTIEVIYREENGQVWIGSLGGGLDHFNPSTERFGHVFHDPDDPKSLSHNNVWAFLEDREGHLWVGTMAGGLNRRNKTGSRFSHQSRHPSLQAMSTEGIWCLYQDHKNNIWVGTYGGGLYRISLPGNTICEHQDQVKANPEDWFPWRYRRDQSPRDG